MEPHVQTLTTVRPPRQQVHRSSCAPLPRRVCRSSSSTTASMARHGRRDPASCVRSLGTWKAAPPKSWSWTIMRAPHPIALAPAADAWRIMLRRWRRNHGFARAVNEGLPSQSGGVVAAPEPGRDPRSRFRRRRPCLGRTASGGRTARLGVVGFRLRNADGSSQASTRAISDARGHACCVCCCRSRAASTTPGRPPSAVPWTGPPDAACSSAAVAGNNSADSTRITSFITRT